MQFLCFESIFRQNAIRRSAYYHRVRRPSSVVRHSSSFVVHHKVSGSNILETVLPRITKYIRYIHTDLPYSHIIYDVTGYFRSDVIAKETLVNAASDGFRWNLSIHFTRLSATTGYDVTSCFPSVAKCN